MSDQYEQIAPYPTLTDAQRIQARKNAARNIVEKYARKPRREDFDDYARSRFPRWFTALVALLLVFVALSAGVISAFRLYFAGYTQFYASVENETMARIVGVLTPLAAEVLVIVAAVAMQVHLHAKGRARLIALVPVATGTIVAFVGNWQIAQPASTWGWVETLFPPVAVLSVALFFEITLVPELERRQANENAYREARADYDLLMSNPEAHGQWNNVYGWALWEMWAHVFQQDYEISEIDRAKRQLIALREMSADRFFEGEIASLAAISGKQQQESAPSVTKQDVLEWLRDNPGAKDLSGKEIAEITGASEATVSRARKLFSMNGYGEN